MTDTDATPSELDTMLLSEELIEAFRADMGRLAFAVRNLELPDSRTRRLFRPLEIDVRDLSAEAGEPDPDPRLQALGMTSRNWPIAESTQETSASLRLWRPLFDRVDRFSRAKFKIKSGHFLENEEGKRHNFEMRVAFSGLATLRSGDLSWVHSYQTLRWRLISGRDPKRPENWRISAWIGEEARRLDGTATLFEDVLDDAIPDLAQLGTARLSIHERYIAGRLLAKRAGKPYQLPHPLFSDVATNRHPGLAIVDIDGDGFDDLYVMARWGRNQLLRNRGDGTFVEMASEVGLDIDGFSSSAIFADFDNDGDPDLFLGRTLVRSEYYENQGGHFVERSNELIDFDLPYSASSVSASDYDGDGLLDIYVSTYSSTGVSIDLYRERLSKDDYADLMELASKKKLDLLDQLGPPNILFHNEGDGHFTLAKNPGALRSFRHTYQSTWSDFDSDGDPDVYLSNDFGPDTVIRNDGEAGFVDATADLGFNFFGLGMGASWGDYDRDGRLDAYVTNMYSTAGSRITKQLSFVDKRYREMAQGNYLYRNEGDQFRKVSGSTPPALAVERTGWSWGSQFVDVDNDGFLDLGVLNGFYTAPREVALSGDT